MYSDGEAFQNTSRAVKKLHKATTPRSNGGPRSDRSPSTSSANSNHEEPIRFEPIDELMYHIQDERFHWAYRLDFRDRSKWRLPVAEQSEYIRTLCTRSSYTVFHGYTTTRKGRIYHYLFAHDRPDKIEKIIGKEIELLAPNELDKEDIIHLKKDDLVEMNKEKKHNGVASTSSNDCEMKPESHVLPFGHGLRDGTSPQQNADTANGRRSNGDLIKFEAAESLNEKESGSVDSNDAAINGLTADLLLEDIPVGATEHFNESNERPDPKWKDESNGDIMWNFADLSIFEKKELEPVEEEEVKKEPEAEPKQEPEPEDPAKRERRIKERLDSEKKDEARGVLVTFQKKWLDEGKDEQLRTLKRLCKGVQNPRVMYVQRPGVLRVFLFFEKGSQTLDALTVLRVSCTKGEATFKRMNDADLVSKRIYHESLLNPEVHVNLAELKAATPPPSPEKKKAEAKPAKAGRIPPIGSLHSDGLSNKDDLPREPFNLAPIGRRGARSGHVARRLVENTLGIRSTVSREQVREENRMVAEYRASKKATNAKRQEMEKEVEAAFR